jgi:aminomethyltransferase
VSALQRTPLYDVHVRLGGRMVEFAGFEMPVQYSSILAEHAAVRSHAGLFDVSHMGQIHFAGSDALATVERLVSCPVASLRPGRVRYGLLCNESGGVVDDVTVYRQGPDSLFLCVNAANIEKDFEWIRGNSPASAGADNRSAQTGLLALQGPNSASLLESLCSEPASALGRFRFAEMEVAGAQALLSRTGYTGSDGFEIYLDAADTVRVFDALMEAGDPHGLTPVGLGARDTLRLEAALPLYGHELDDETSPLEAGLDRFVKPDGFIGAAAIARRAEAGHAQQLVGFEITGRGVARAGHSLKSPNPLNPSNAPTEGDGVIGRVTSGAPSPTLGHSIGLAYVAPEYAAVGTQLEVQIRGRGVAARVVKTPFVSARS